MITPNFAMAANYGGRQMQRVTSFFRTSEAEFVRV